MKKEDFLKLMDGIDDRLVEKYAISDEAEAMMEKTGITHLSSKDCNRMSGGELQMRHL